MGNKIITEKDFWQCEGGLMPTQFQSGQNVAKKKSGEKYITKMDTATVSFADFSCKKLMLIMAILAALVAVLTVATGGAALIAIGAIAGAAGAAYGAVLGSLLCGQMVAKVRKWTMGKENFQIMGIPTITGDHVMLCPLFGDKITFAPEIKTWGQALAKGGANLISGIMEGMMAGALIGMGGGLLSGGRAAVTSGGFRGLGQAGFNFLKSAPNSIMSNFGQGLFNGAGFKLIDGATNWLNTYGDTGSASTDDFTQGVKESTFGDVAAIRSILTTGGTMQDWVAAIMLLTPGGKKSKGNHNNSHIAEPNVKPKGDADGGSNKKADADEGGIKPKSHSPDAPNNKGKDGEAYEADKPKLLNKEGDAGTFKDLINNGKRGDNVTPHHMPSAKYLENNTNVKYDDGVAMNMEHPHPGNGGRHRETSTYDNKMTKAEQQAYWDKSPREALAHDIRDARKIYQEQGLYTDKIKEGLLEVIKQNKTRYPDLFKK